MIEEFGVAVVNKDTGVVRENPLMKIKLAYMSFVAKQLERLGVNSEAPKQNGRPAGAWNFEKVEA